MLLASQKIQKINKITVNHFQQYNRNKTALSTTYSGYVKLLLVNLIKWQ